jgi:hypothetical protein
MIGPEDGKIGVGCCVLFLLLSFAERQKGGTAEKGRPERSELETLPAVATTVLFGDFHALPGIHLGQLLP